MSGPWWRSADEIERVSVDTTELLSALEAWLPAGDNDWEPLA